MTPLQLLRQELLTLQTECSWKKVRLEDADYIQDKAGKSVLRKRIGQYQAMIRLYRHSIKRLKK